MIPSPLLLNLWLFRPYITRMKSMTLWVCLTILAATTPLRSAQKSPTFDVHRPTILAFFPPVTDAELAKNPDTNTVLDDFQFYAASVREPLTCTNRLIRTRDQGAPGSRP